MTDPKTIQLFIAPGCPHCPNMIKVASELVKKGDIGKLEIVNIAVASELASQANIRSVPTFLVGDITLNGVHTASELLQWIARSASSEGLSDYFNQAFEQGELSQIISQVEKKPDMLDHLLNMLTDMQTPLTSRIAISAVFEHFQQSPEVARLAPRLCELADNDHASIRTDIAYLMGLSGSPSVVDCLEKMTRDPFEDVRETALEALQAIRDAR